MLIDNRNVVNDFVSYMIGICSNPILYYVLSSERGTPFIQTPEQPHQTPPPLPYVKVIQ